MLIEIKHCIGKILHTIEADNLRSAVIALVNSGADLSGANLSEAYISRAYLSEAYLSGANLSGANLSEAYLSRAYLSGANLSGAYLSGANLSGAYLSDLSCLTELSDAIDLASLIWEEWQKNGIESAKNRFGLYQAPHEDKALIAMCPRLIGGYCFVLRRREIWWWNWSCPNPETVPVLWRQEA